MGAIHEQVLHSRGGALTLPGRRCKPIQEPAEPVGRSGQHRIDRFSCLSEIVFAHPMLCFGISDDWRDPRVAPQIIRPGCHARVELLEWLVSAIDVLVFMAILLSQQAAQLGPDGAYEPCRYPIRLDRAIRLPRLYHNQ